MSVLLVVLFQFLVAHARVEQTSECKAALQLQRERLQSRLETLFINSLRDGFYTDEQGLHARFNAGVDPDPAFSGEQKALLNMRGKDFCFTQEASAKSRTEILWKNAPNVQWFFFGKNEKGAFEWLSIWPKTRSDHPSMIRLTLGDEERFAFILPSQEPVVLR